LREWNARDHRQPLAQRPVLEPSPLSHSSFAGMDFSKSTEQKLEEGLAKIAELKEMMEEEIKRQTSLRVSYMKGWIQ